MFLSSNNTWFINTGRAGSSGADCTHSCVASARENVVPGAPALSSSSPLPGVSGSKLDVEPQQRSPLVEVKGNIELKGPLAKAASRPSLLGRRPKRRPDQMEEALKPEKKITGGLGTRVATTPPPQSSSRHLRLPRSQAPDTRKPGPVVPARKPGKPKCPVWDLKGQLCGLNAELKCSGERKQMWDQENQQRWDQLREAQQQALALGAECRRLGVDTGFDRLGNLSAWVLELEKWLGVKEGLVQGLQKEQLRSQEESLQASEASLSDSQAEVASLCQKAAAWELHNQLQELKGTIRVFCRVSPILPGESTPSPGSFQFPSGPSVGTLSGVPAAPTHHDFPFDRVFSPGSRQDEVFEEISTLVHSALDDDPVCIFAYGQTGSGNTFTMEGGPGGDGPRLLAAGTRKGQGGECVIRQAGPGSEELNVTDTLALQNRAVASTAQNERSLRGHGVFQLQISGEHAGRGLQCLAPLSLVDLAGNEQLDPGLSLGPGEWEHLRETLAINSGLSTLGLVIMALSNKEFHGPYENSKLTYLLQNSLGDSAEMLMFVNISPLEENVSKFLNSLRFSSKVNQCVIGTSQVNQK
ncbi:hypothetical protein FD754_018701 [Muntiacus muntjak]|uniref:Kinesin-like protein n=1 Tax=Muntiacus muntjak TaxID=9888 RepID=A0A5N3UY94_MUNMU|nr:hypothetical protein FD754_018701 [Muntiacus muntjak]